MISILEDDDFRGFEAIQSPEPSCRQSLLPEKVAADHAGFDRESVGEILGFFNHKSNNKRDLLVATPEIDQEGKEGDDN